MILAVERGVKNNTFEAKFCKAELKQVLLDVAAVSHCMTVSDTPCFLHHLFLKHELQPGLSL